MADALADSAEEYRKAESPNNAKFSKVFSLVSGFTHTTGTPLHASATGGTSTPGMSWTVWVWTGSSSPVAFFGGGCHFKKNGPKVASKGLLRHFSLFVLA